MQKSKKKNIEIFEEINEDLVIEEEPEIKIVEKINEDPIIEKDLETVILETIKEKLQGKLSTISMKSSQMIAMFKLPLFWWETLKQSLLILLGLIDLIQLTALIW